MLACRRVDGLDPLATVVPSPIPPIPVSELPRPEHLSDGDVEDVFTAQTKAFGHAHHFSSAPIGHRDFLLNIYY